MATMHDEERAGDLVHRAPPPSSTEAARIREMVHTRSWYHVIEVAPGVTTPGRYDPRQVLEVMRFPLDFRGKTVLDVGCYAASSRSRRNAGAPNMCWPRTDIPPDPCGFAMARDLLRSRVDYWVASVYDLNPAAFGTFDVVLFLGALYHLRHPLLALDCIHSLCREYMFLETHVLDRAFLSDGQRLSLSQLHPSLATAALLQFYPHDELNEDPSNWFAPTVSCVEQQMLASSGFTSTLGG